MASESDQLMTTHSNWKPADKRRSMETATDSFINNEKSLWNSTYWNTLELVSSPINRALFFLWYVICRWFCAKVWKKTFARGKKNLKQKRISKMVHIKNYQILAFASVLVLCVNLCSGTTAADSWIKFTREARTVFKSCPKNVM